MEKLHDKWLRLVGIPMVAVLGSYVFYQPGNDANHVSLFKSLSLSLVECVMIWEGVRVGIIRARRRYPLLNQTRPRILYQVLWFIAATVIIRVGTTFFYDLTNFWGHHPTLRDYCIDVIVPFFFTIPIAAIYEGRYLYRQWWTTYYEAERLKKENLQSQLDSLKSQISPHFLFNSLSTLSSLVSEDPRKAEWFIEELSSVYRYLLQTNEHPLTTLENELRFVEAYFHLLETRFGKGVKLETAIDEDYYGYLIPPLTLQLLVENAVKHNAILPSQPLLIRIYSDEVANLHVLNNRCKKQNVVPSSKLGLKNIASKYKLLNQPDLLVKETDDCFQVTIPLIKASTHESIPH